MSIHAWLIAKDLAHQGLAGLLHQASGRGVSVRPGPGFESIRREIQRPLDTDQVDRFASRKILSIEAPGSSSQLYVILIADKLIAQIDVRRC
jgi:hypothetical protein